MAKPKADAIVRWAEAHTQDQQLAPNAGAKHLTPDEIAEVLHWNAQGLTQEQIAAKFEPPKHQTTISRCLRDWGPDRTREAKRMARAAAPRMVADIVNGRDGKVKALLLKGIGVLEEQQQSGVTVIVGGGSEVKIGVLVSPQPSQGQSESE